MNIRLRLFAVSKEIAGSDVIELALPDSATIAELKTALIERHPQFEAIVNSLAFAINQEYATDATTIHPHDELACIPPVSGG